MYEKPYRSILKSVSWRVTGTIDTTLISYLITGSIETAASIGIIEIFTKMLLYFLHERLWNKINIGKKSEPEYHI
ncbi:DUF2061 domain-containing protein [Melioribacter sp. Ez-97]|uniref:DUF2061 domain-containing protein n=1 Tax=Melioribacter sp. Ez-97 TaxID=3423434 RepID=UPI003ED9FA79